jgi:hypothetical protein
MRLWATYNLWLFNENIFNYKDQPWIKIDFQ